MDAAAVVDKVAQHHADGDHDLEQACDAATDVLGRAFGDVGGRDGRDTANAEARDHSAGVDVGDAFAVAGYRGQDLQNAGKCEQMSREQE